MEATLNNPGAGTNIRTLAGDPQYFGAYLNMARHNVFLINNHLAAKFNSSGVLTDEACIKCCFLTKEVPDNPNHLYSHLVRLLPLVKIFNTAMLPAAERKAEQFQQESIDFGLLARVLKDCFTELGAFRNDYSHYYAKTFVNQPVTRKLVIPEALSEWLRTLYQKAILYTKDRFSTVFTDVDFAHLQQTVLVEQDNTITPHGLAFFTCLFLQREYAFLFLGKVKGFKNTQTKPFLATREVFCAYCLKLPADKLISDDREQATILDMLNYLNRCPDELFHCLAPAAKQAFQPTLDVYKTGNVADNSINTDTAYEDYDDYIKSITSQRRHGDRFPYFALHYLDAQEGFTPLFHINLGKAILKSYPKMVLGKEVVRDVADNIKTFGRLSHFYFDEVETEEERGERAKSMLQIDSGTRFTQYAPHYHIENNKIAISTTGSADANAQLSIHELPKLVLLELLEKGMAAQLINDFLHINKEVILNRDVIENIKKQLGFEQSLRRAYFNRKVVYYADEVYDNLDAEIAGVKNSLEGLNKEDRYYEDEKKRLKEDLNSLIYWKYVEDINHRKERLNTILAQYNLTTKQIPGRIVDYWLNINLVKEETTIKNSIKEQKKDCKDRLKMLEKNRGPKIGQMATWLAKDIVAMVIDEPVKKKITSFYYDKMQECLALFADRDKKAYFLDLCQQELHLFDDTTGHPFLKDIDFNSINRTTDLYRAYLKAKGAGEKTEKYYDRKIDKWKEKQVEDNWMHNTFYSKQKNEKTGKMDTVIAIPATGKPLPLVIKRMLKERSSFDAWLNNTTAGKESTDKPRAVDLPTNLFDAALVALLKPKAGIAAADTKVYNYTKLLELWLKDTQPFYNDGREYELYKDANGTPAVTVAFTPGTQKSYAAYFDAPMNHYFKSENQRIRNENRAAPKGTKRKPELELTAVLSVFNNAITENEKAIRFSQTKDRVMRLVLEELLQTRADMPLQIWLKDIYPASEKSPLNSSFKLMQKVPGKLFHGGTPIQKTITDENRKIKDYGAFRKLLTDRRLPELFQYFDGEEIPYPQLHEELKAYNVYKDQVFDLVFTLEKACIAKMTVEEINTALIEKSKKPNIQHNPYLKWLRAKGLLHEAEYTLVSTVRNAFSHNQFPPKGIMGKAIVLKEGVPIAQQAVEQYSAVMEKIIGALQ